ncbi:hypothetical protein TgHK011_003555 [Trichoderma gracile]|nr:hypothetical protein TgHK011_003555 [Trichoderma gracile]
MMGRNGKRACECTSQRSASCHVQERPPVAVEEEHVERAVSSYSDKGLVSLSLVTCAPPDSCHRRIKAQPSPDSSNQESPWVVRKKADERLCVLNPQIGSLGQKSFSTTATPVADSTCAMLSVK